MSKYKRISIGFLIRSSLLAILLILVGGSNLGAQFTLSQLQKQKKNAESRIAHTNELIKKSGESQKLNLQKISLIESQIQVRNDLLNNIIEQVKLFKDQISTTEQKIKEEEQSIKKLQAQYVEFLKKAQFTTSQSQVLLFILASQNLAQFYRRIRFYKEYKSYQNQQYNLIVMRERDLSQKRDSLHEDLKKFIALQDEEKRSKSLLEKEKDNYDAELKRLMKQEKKLKKQIEQDQKNLEQLNREINRLIKEEAEANKKTKRDARYLKLSSSFAENKGRLPWPVENGTVTRGYGLQRSKHFKNVKTNSQGIDIACNANSSVSTVFSGTVTKVAHITGGNDVIIIRHGDYLSLYSNITDVQVKAGENVQSGQKIGTAFTEKGSKTSTVHFEIWKGFNSENPTLWLSK